VSFFFSSRRRHTRWPRDWSSDVCSSDLKRLIPHTLIDGNGSFLFWMRTNTEGPYLVMTPAAGCGLEYFEPQRFGNGVAYYVHSRSEERRVGKESSNRWQAITRLHSDSHR